MNNKRTPIAVFAPLYPPAFRGGGPIRSISALVKAAPECFEPLVLTCDRDLGLDSPLMVTRNQWTVSGEHMVYYATTRSPRFAIKALMALRRKRPKLLHFNGFMDPSFTIIPLVLWRFGFWGKPLLLVAPRGEFGEAALRRRSRKKRAYLFLFRSFRIHKHVVWHSTAPHETDDLRQLWGKEAVIIERGNDTALDSRAMTVTQHDGPTRMVFLGRIVPHKGLAVILEALQAVRSDVEFNVYGPREDAQYFAHCKRLAATLPPNVAIAFRDALEPDSVVQVLNQHDLFVLPTAGENFGHVIAEALSAACVVLTTPWTPWGSVLEGGGGIVVGDREASSWAPAVESQLSASRELRFARRQAAGEAFERWAAEEAPPHVWTLALERA